MAAYRGDSVKTNYQEWLALGISFLSEPFRIRSGWGSPTILALPNFPSLFVQPLELPEQGHDQGQHDPEDGGQGHALEAHRTDVDVGA